MEDFSHKSTVDEIRERFDNDVERFSNLETGQVAAVDSLISLELITACAAATTPHAKNVLDIGCGAGNYSLKLLQRLPKIHLTLLDLSNNMLQRAEQRIREVSSAGVELLQIDVREADLGVQRFDVVIAAQCLHHLRDQDQWQMVFQKIFDSLRPGGSFWIVDAVEHEIEGVQAVIQQRWGEYLAGIRDEAYRDFVLDYIEKEDTPRPLCFQLKLLCDVGFDRVDVLHKNNRFATFGAVKLPGSGA